MSEQDEESCFVKVLSHYVSLGESERQTIKKLEDDKRHFSKGDYISTEQDALEHLYIVSSGQLYSATGTGGESRIVTAIHFAGDCLGFHDLAFTQTTVSTIAAVDSTVCAIEKSALGQLSHEEPRLFALMMALAARDQVILIDRLRSIAKYSAKDRILHMLLHLLHRQRITLGAETVEFRLPVNQRLIGDYLALTNVSVSVAMSQLEREGVIERSRDNITLCDVESSIEKVSFVDRYHVLDTDWMDPENSQQQ